MLLYASFRIQPKEVIAFVGGGGKTTAMFRLAEELAAQGKRVITTTTTRIFAVQIKLAPFHLNYDSSSDFLERVRKEISVHPHILIVGETNEEGGTSPKRSGGEKALGVPPELVDKLIALADAVVYEADGSRMRPLKAPAAHEPVIAASTTLLVPIVGISAIGAPLDEKNVHRPEIVARIANAELGQPIAPELVARVVSHPEGGLKDKPRGSRAIALVNQVENTDQLNSAREIAQQLLSNDAIDAVAIGAVKNANPILETHRRVAAVIAAAGAGTRMNGRIKQLLPWRGKTLIENAIAVATESEATEIIVVLGAHAEEITRRLDVGAKPILVLNRNWEEGHASTIRVALAALSPQTDAALFINADQPFLTRRVVNEIIQRYRETDARIVVPTFAGKRGSPVLFRRMLFDELRGLRGEQGGREVIAKYGEGVEYVAFEDARLGVDVDTMEEYEHVIARAEGAKQSPT